MTEKDSLRNQLFEKYFEVDEGIVLSDLMNHMKPILQIWRNLDQIFEKNMDDYNCFRSVEAIKLIEHNHESYLIIKFRFWDYLLINTKTKRILTKEDVSSQLDEAFFVTYFDEMQIESSRDILARYWFSQYDGDVDELLEFYYHNKDVLDMPSTIHYKLTIGEAWTYLWIDLKDGSGQLGFQTPNQFLYEQLFFHADLTPSAMQDSTRKIGSEKMKEIFSRMKEIKIPVSCIPIEPYQKCFQLNDSMEPNEQLKLVKKKKPTLQF